MLFYFFNFKRLSKGLNSYYIARAKLLVDVHAAVRKMIMHCMHTSQIECVHFTSMEPNSASLIS